MLVAFHKPWGVLSQFTEDGSRNRPLKDFGFPPRVYPIGRLDADSEGLLLLSDEAHWTERLLDPRQAHPRRYWAQVEGTPEREALARLEKGIEIQGRRTRPARVWLLDPQPQVAPRDPPIRVRLRVPDRWIALELIEGRNRQVRRMTAAIGHPTLRLIRVRIGLFELGDLGTGTWRVLGPEDEQDVLRDPADAPGRPTPAFPRGSRATFPGDRFWTRGKA
ncbi:MAG: pseudouridine synthase [Verrucomicrobiales bacterium]|nr:pseudouridine synthase [Verrucomicrobiales bacterium]